MKENKITVPELQEILNEDKRVFILDVRPEEEREEWYIPESHHIDVYEELKDGREDVFDDKDLPHNIPVVTICDAGKTSQTAADILAGKGYQVYSLEGGMKAWNFAWNTAELSLHDSGLKIIQVRRTAKGCLSYLAGSDDEAIVVDASLDPEIYLNIARDNGWKIRYVMDTHIRPEQGSWQHKAKQIFCFWNLQKRNIHTCRSGTDRNYPLAMLNSKYSIRQDIHPKVHAILLITECSLPAIPCSQMALAARI
jgi:rhodanese-related sulfurtransferase